MDAPLEGDRLAAMASFLSDVQLALLCSDGWSGIVIADKDGKDVPVEDPDLGSVALLLSDTAIRTKVAGRLYSSILEEVQEKKEFAVSPNGGAAADAEPAPTAGA
jgi:hypothetical protein